MTGHNNNEKDRAVSAWEDDGGAQRPHAADVVKNAWPPSGRRRLAQGRLDASHDSDRRGEHRYDAAHQTAAATKARQERDDLK